MSRTSSPNRPRRGLLALAGAAALVVVACGDDDDDASETTTDDAPAAATEPTTPAPTATDAASAAAGTTAATAGGSSGDDAVVAVAESSLGPILVDGEGMTLYMFVPDEQGPSTCVDACLEAWPAIPGPAEAGDGADEALLGTAPRPDDGSDQATCGGWPLYTFVQDAAPGDVTGQGVGDNWYVLDATCAPVGR